MRETRVDTSSERPTIRVLFGAANAGRARHASCAILVMSASTFELLSQLTFPKSDDGCVKRDAKPAPTGKVSYDSIELPGT